MSLSTAFQKARLSATYSSHKINSRLYSIVFGLRRVLLGPFSNVYREGNLLFFKVPEDCRDRILEESLKPGLKISPEKIVRAYKSRLGRYWILVRYERGYDLYKHFRLAPRDRYAWRIPRITVEACPRCGEDIVEGVCLECSEKIEKPKHLEVWRDREAVEELIPIHSIKEDPSKLTILSRGVELKIPRQIIHEKIVSIVGSRPAYVKILSLFGR